MTPYVWTGQSLADATQGIWQGLYGDFHTTGIITDTRKLKVGDVFLALKGDNFDGHEFAKIAKEKGAIAIIGERDVACDLPFLKVADSRLALGALGAYRRRAHPELTVIALTGSSGKTTTKEMLGSILSQVAPTLITKGNLNNDLGVPMMLLELTDEHRFAVLELGANHVGEIAYTAGLVSPDVACVLNIGTAHLGEFGGRQNIAKAKAEIYEALGEQGVAVLPFGDDFFDFLQTSASIHTQNLLTFGERMVPLSQAQIDWHGLSDEEKNQLSQLDSVLMMGDVFADDVETSSTSSQLTLAVNLTVDNIQSTTLNLPFVGEHNITNALASVACATAVGVPFELVVSGLTKAKPPKGRLTRILFGEHVLIDDTYNANPTSVMMAAKVLQSEMTQKILVLGDIGELGELSDELHGQLGKDLAQLEIDYILTVGTLMAFCTQHITQINPSMSEHFQNKTELLSRLSQLLTMPSTVLFKGSRTARMETLIDDLTQQKGE